MISLLITIGLVLSLFGWLCCEKGWFNDQKENPGIFMLLVGVSCVGTGIHYWVQQDQREMKVYTARIQACESACKAKGYIVKSCSPTLCVCDTSALILIVPTP